MDDCDSSAENGRLAGMPNETLHAVLVAGLGPRWFFIVRGVCRLWRDVVDASALDAVRGLPDDHECLCGAAPERMDDCCCDPCYRSGKRAPSGDDRRPIPVRASDIVEWISMRPELWEAPEAVVTWCTSIGGASLADAAAVLVASNRPPLVEHAAEMILREAATTGGRVVRQTPGWLYGGQMLSISDAVFHAALQRGCASTLTALLDAAPGFLTHGDADQGWNFKVAVCGDNPDAVEYLLRSGFNPWSGDDEYQHSDAWHMIGDNGAGRVLARLLDIMADTTSAEPLGALLRSAWDERGPRAFDGASVPVLDVILERGYTICLEGLLWRACRYADVAVLSWAMKAAPRLGTPVDVGYLARLAVTAAYDNRLRSTSRPEAVVRWLFDRDGGGYVPARAELRDLLCYVSDESESGDTGCTVFLLERWPHEAALQQQPCVCGAVGAGKGEGGEFFICAPLSAAECKEGRRSRRRETWG